jgi:hypothetical protein
MYILQRLAYVLATILVLTKPLSAIEPATIEVEVLKHRRSIKSIVVDVESRMSLPQQGRVETSVRRIWQDGGFRKCDATVQILDASERPLEPRFHSVSLESPEFFAFWSDRGEGPAGRKVGHLEKWGTENIKAFSRYWSFDPRLLGLNPQSLSLLRDSALDAVVASKNRTAPAAITENDEGILLTYERASGTVVTQLYQRVGEQHLLRKAILENTKSRLSMECQWDSGITGGALFPHKISVIQTVGEDIAYDEDVTISVISLDEPIPPLTFTLESLGLRPGTPIVGTAIPPALINRMHHVEWDGRRLVSAPNTGP